jgi:hypothetical protein
MAHKWRVLQKRFMDGVLMEKRYEDVTYTSLNEAAARYLNWYGFVPFYPGKLDSRNFLWWKDGVGSEIQVWFEQVY